MINKKVSAFGMFIVGALLFFAIGWILFSAQGKKLQLQYFGSSYIPTDAVITEKEISYNSGGRKWNTSGFFLQATLQYSVDGKQYTEFSSRDTFKGLSSGGSFQNDENVARTQAEILYPDFQVGNHLTIYIEPGHGETFVLDPEEEPHFWFIFLFVFPMMPITLSMMLGGWEMFFQKQQNEKEAR